MVNNNKRDNNIWWLIIIALIVGLFLFIISRLRIQKANDDLKKHWQERKEVLNDIYVRREYYRKEKVEILYVKKQTTIFLRFFVSGILIIMNGLFISNCYPNDLNLQHLFECIATFNAGLLFIIGIITFAFFGSFFEVKVVYHSFQAVTLAWLFKEKEQAIDAIIKLDLESVDAIRREIENTETAIKQNEEILNYNLDPNEKNKI